MPTGGTRATGRGWVGGVCFAYFQPGVRKALTESPVVCWGSELGFLMTTLRNMFSFASSPAMLWLLGWIPIDVEDKEKSHHSASIPVWRRWISRATKVADIWYLYICYSTFRHVDDNQLLSNAPWISCSIHPKPIIMPLYMVMIKKRVYVWSMTFIILVVWWLVAQLCCVVAKDLLGH